MNESIKKSDYQPSVLCVEDDQDTCDLIRILLSDYQVIFAHSVREALNSFETKEFDLIMLDNWLPDGSGIELCSRIHELHPHVPIVFASGIGEKSEIRKALDAGANKYLVKPYEPMNLQKIVKDLLENSQK